MVTCTEENVPKNISEYVDRLTEQNKGMNVTMTQNKTQHQRKNNECGMYCLYYILNRINGRAYDDDVPEIKDEYMTFLRTQLFTSDDLCPKCHKLKQ